MAHQHKKHWTDKRAALAHETMALLAEVKELDPSWDDECDARVSAARAQFPAREEPGDGQEGVTR